MSKTVAPLVQLPDGYIPIERIGSGGYGEVWRVTAPGGVEKAAKVVFGHFEEELAERELKSLERIRSVRHPFVISLERFEVVAGRLVIVTELADMSLDSCFRKYQESGQPGIPRNELLAFLRDAAEALDCLVDRHSLQHLDIKPENLLVVGDHVKLGDFGLVKELAARTSKSLMGGMTPIYSAPEVFDDSPSPHSDQYSLAIVFQQMLTGQLPFQGRTPAQLAKQHTQAEPILCALSVGDRRIVGKALAKRPEQRFGTCKEFIAALTVDNPSSLTSVSISSNAAARYGAEKKNDDTKTNAALRTQPLAESPRAVSHIQPQVQAATPAASVIEALHFPIVEGAVEDIPIPEIGFASDITLPTLVVGVGGLGMTILNATRRRMAPTEGTDTLQSQVAWLAIDTDRNSLREAASYQESFSLQSDEMIHIPLKRPKEYGDGSSQLLKWVSRRWLYNIPRSLETRGYRPLGRIAAVDHAEVILSNLYAKLYQLSQNNSDAATLRVVLLTSTSGGTGSGMIVDLGQAVRSLALDLNVSIGVDVVLAMPERATGSAESLSVVNTYSLLTEIAHAQRSGNQGSTPVNGPAARYEAPSPPFDTVYWMSIPPRNDHGNPSWSFDSIAEHLALETTNPEAAALFMACREAGKTDDFRLQSYGCTTPAISESTTSLLDDFKLSVTSCNYKRMMFAICPKNSTGLKALQKQLPSLVTRAAKVPKDVLVTVAVGIDPLHLAASLAEYYPDIAEAAGRMQTRNDIDWQDLRRSRLHASGIISDSPESRPDTSDQSTLKRCAVGHVQ